MAENTKNNKLKDTDDLVFMLDHGVDVKNRIIQLVGEAGSDFNFEFVDSAMTSLEARSRAGITVRIFSLGGAVYDALAIVGRLRASKCKITTEGYGGIMSAATLILASGNYRRLSEFSVFMHHESSYGVGGRHSQIKEEIQQAEREEELWAQWMARFSTKSADWWYNQGKHRNLYMTPEMVAAVGVIDEVF
jgi:ATP-dependent protease ClpP protease subunit